jgi:hypothetical protein
MATYDDETEQFPLTTLVVSTIRRALDETDDIGELPFGEQARTERDGDTLTVRHETDDVPAVRITVERIA